MNFKSKEVSNPNEIVPFYVNGLIDILDNHAPKKKIKITVQSKTPCTSEEIHPDKTRKCRLERKWLRTKLNIGKQNFIDQRNKSNGLDKLDPLNLQPI